MKRCHVCVRLDALTGQRVCVHVYVRAEQMFSSLEKMAPLYLFNMFAAQPHLA